MNTRWGYKQFVTEGKEPQNISLERIRSQKLKNNLNGDEIRQFYEETITATSYPEQSLSNVQRVAAKSSSSKQNIARVRTACKQKKHTFTKNDLFRAITSNDINLVEKIIDTNRDLIHMQDQFNWTTLMMAACEGHYDICEFLLLQGINPNGNDSKGNDAVSLAEKKGFSDIAKLIKSFGVSVSDVSNSNSGNDGKEFYCELCKANITENTKQEHEASTLHQFNMKKESNVKVPLYGIPASNKGYQLMLKQGWDKNHGLGPDQKGKQYPIKTVIRKNRAGLGVKQKTARVTHFGPYDPEAIKFRPGVKPTTKRDILREKTKNQRLERMLRRELS